MPSSQDLINPVDRHAQGSRDAAARADVIRLAANAPEYRQEEYTAYLCVSIHNLCHRCDITVREAIGALDAVERFIKGHLMLANYYMDELGRPRPSNAEARLFWNTCADILEQESK